MRLHELGPERADDVAALVASALPDEQLSAAELRDTLWEGGGRVWTTDDAGGVVSTVIREAPDRPVGCVRLLAVHPDARGSGVGRALLRHAEDQVFGDGAVEAQIGWESPFYLFPGVDVRWTPMLALAESEWFERAHVVLVFGCAVTSEHTEALGRDLAASALTVRPVSADDLPGLVAEAELHYPFWTAALERAVARGTAWAALDDAGRPAGFSCHSVSRRAWVGPVAVLPDHRGRGAGRALLAAALADLRAAGHERARLEWVPDTAFVHRAVGATVERVYLNLKLPRAVWRGRR